MEHFQLTVRYFIYSLPKAKCRPGHLNVNLLNIAISHSLHLQSLHHNPPHSGQSLLRGKENPASATNSISSKIEGWKIPLS